MKIALFDLDNTLIAGDSDCLWGEFLCEKNQVNADDYQQQHDRFYQDYLDGQLDIDAFLKFQLSSLTATDLPHLLSLREDYMATKIEPVLLDRAVELIESHRQQDHTLMIITATNRFLTELIAEKLGIHHLIACEPEFVDGAYTGNYRGIPSYQEGKIKRLELWQQENNAVFDESWFYSDSHNDIPLLEKVTHPVAVDPDDKLTNKAVESGWPIISLR